MPARMVRDREIVRVGLRRRGESIDDLSPALIEQLIRQGHAERHERAPSKGAPSSSVKESSK